MPKAVNAPLTIDQIQALAKPKGNYEAVPGVLFDTQTFTSNSSMALTFFNTSGQSVYASNVNGSGMMPANTFFVVHSIHIQPLLAPSLKSSATDASGALNDMYNLMIGGQPILTVSLNNKQVVPGIPAGIAQGFAGVTGGITGSLTAQADLQFANNGIPGNGYAVNGWIILTPGVPYSASLAWPSAITLNGGNTKIAMAFQGDLYRPRS